MEKEKNKFSDQIEKSAGDFLKAKQQKSGFWHSASLIGMGGWLLALPVVAGAYLGRYLDQRFEKNISWTLTFIILGIAAGIYNLWYFLLRKGQQ